MAKNLGINIKIGADLKRFSSDMQNVQRQMKRTGKKMKSIGTSMTRSLTLPLALIGGASVKLAVDFEQSMAKVKAISGATSEEFNKLSANALELGRTTRYTSEQVADLQLNLSKLGFNPKEITDATAAILSLSLATGEDLADSATVAASTLKGFDLQATESGRVADVMASAFSNSALDLEKFKVAMATVAPIAHLAGASLEETSAILGVLTDRGMDASTAGTSLRNIYLRLSQQGLSWAEAMDKVKNAQNPLNAAQEIFGVRAAAASAIIANNAEQLDALTGTLNNSAGSSKKMADIMDNTLNGALLRMKSALEGVGIQIGEALTPVIKAISERIIKLSEWFSGLSEATKKNILVVAGLAAAIGPLLVAMGSLTLLIPSIKAALVALTGPVGLIVMGLTAIAIVIAKNWSKIAPKIQEVTDYFTELYNESYAVRHSIQSIVLVFKLLFRVAKMNLLNIWEVFKGFGSLIADLFGGMGKLIKGVFTGTWEDVKDGVKELSGAVKGNMKDVLNGITDNASDMMEDVKGDFADFNDALNKKVKPVVIPIEIGGKKDKKDKKDDISKTGGKGKAGFDVLSMEAKKATVDLSEFGKVAEELPKAIDGIAYSMDNLHDDKSMAFFDNMKNATYELKEGLKSLVVEGFEGLFVAIGEQAAGVDTAFKDFGANILQSVATFMGQFGKLLIAGAIASEAMQKALFSNPPLALAAGIGLVAVAGLIKGLSTQNPTTHGGGGGGSSPVSYNNNFGGNGGTLTLETVVYGNDIVLSSNRQHNTNMRTRRK